MATKLFIGNLGYGVTSSTLRDLFATVGQVISAEVIVDRYTNRSKGFGFVEMADDAGTQAAIDELNGKDLEGRDLVVNEARPKEPRSNGGGDRDRGQSRSSGQSRGGRGSGGRRY